MSSLRLLDLNFGDRPHAVGVYLVDTTDGPALFDCGPTSTLPALRAGLAEQGLELSDIGNLLLSHIHLDHAGAAGTIVREHPKLNVWVSAIGAPHLVDPSRLENSARRLYGTLFDTLWGELAPVPEANVRIAGEDVLGWECFPTQGHASHHISYFRDGTLLAGDAAGVRMPGASYIVPVSPPPDIDVETWHATIAAIRERKPERLALIHFGVHEDVDAHLDRLDAELDRWAARVRDGMDQEEFVAAAQADAGADADRLQPGRAVLAVLARPSPLLGQAALGRAVDVRARRLRGREHEHLVDRHVRRARQREDDALRHVLRLQRAAEADVRVDSGGLLLVAFEADGRELGLDEAAGDVRDTHRLAEEVFAQRARVPVHGELRGDVRRAVRVGPDARDRADVDDVTVATRDQVLDAEPRHAHQTEDVRLDHLTLVLLVRLPDRVAAPREAGVVDEDVQAAELGDGPRDELLARRRIGDVECAVGA